MSGDPAESTGDTSPAEPGRPEQPGRVRELEERNRRLRRRAEIAEWQLASMRARRLWRVGQAVIEARGSWRGWAALPGRLLDILRDAGGLPPPPDPVRPGSGSRAGGSPPTDVPAEAAGEATGRDEPGRGEPGDWAVQALAHLQAGHQRAVADPVVLAYYPTAPINPFQASIYRELWGRGIAPVPLDDHQRLAGAGAALDRGAAVVFHLHWTLHITRAAQEAREAGRLADRFIDGVDELTGAGGAMLWTIHNTMPHECRFPAVEVRLRRRLADRAAAIHVMCPQTLEATRPDYELPADKVRVIPHPSYAQAYPAPPPRQQARLDLELPAGAAVIGCLGALRDYKGIDRLVAALDRLEARTQRPREVRLLVAGRVLDRQRMEPTLQLLRSHPRVELHLGQIPGDRLPSFVAASDLIVIPHRRVLNSGGLMLALSLGRPVVAPRMGCVPEVVTGEVGVLFEGHGDRALADALDEGLALAARPDIAARARRRARSFDATTVSHRLARLIRDVAGAASPSG